MKEETYGKVFMDTLSGKRRGVTVYIPVEVYPIWKLLKQDCIKNDMSLSYDGGTELLLLYHEIRDIIMSSKPNSRYNVFEEMHEAIKNTIPVLEKTDEEKPKIRSKLFNR